MECKRMRCRGEGSFYLLVHQVFSVWVADTPALLRERLRSVPYMYQYSISTWLCSLWLSDSKHYWTVTSQIFRVILSCYTTVRLGCMVWTNNRPIFIATGWHRLRRLKIKIKISIVVFVYKLLSETWKRGKNDNTLLFRNENNRKMSHVKKSRANPNFRVHISNSSHAARTCPDMSVFTVYDDLSHFIVH